MQIRLGVPRRIQTSNQIVHLLVELGLSAFSQNSICEGGMGISSELLASFHQTPSSQLLVCDNADLIIFIEISELL